MKLNSFFVSILVAVALVSCKNEEKKEATDGVSVETPQEQVVDKSIFTVTLNATVKKDDRLV